MRPLCFMLLSAAVTSTAAAGPWSRNGGCDEDCVECCPTTPQFQPQNDPPDQYVTPQFQPQSVQGESTNLGLRGGSIKFPELTIPLPVIQFPAGFLNRTESRAILSQSEVPVQSRQPVRVQFQPQNNFTPQNDDPSCDLSSLRGGQYSRHLAQREQRIDRLTAQIGELQGLVRTLAEAQRSQLVESREPSLEGYDPRLLREVKQTEEPVDARYQDMRAELDEMKQLCRTLLAERQQLMQASHQVTPATRVAPAAVRSPVSTPVREDVPAWYGDDFGAEASQPTAVVTPVRAESREAAKVEFDDRYRWKTEQQAKPVADEWQPETTGRVKLTARGQSPEPAPKKVSRFTRLKQFVRGN